MNREDELKRLKWRLNFLDGVLYPLGIIRDKKNPYLLGVIAGVLGGVLSIAITWGTIYLGLVYALSFIS